MPQLRRLLDEDGSAWMVQGTPYKLVCPYTFLGPGRWRIESADETRILMTGRFLHRHGLVAARFDTRAEALRTLLALLATEVKAPAPGPASPTLRRQADGSYLDADGDFLITRLSVMTARECLRWEIMPVSPRAKAAYGDESIRHARAATLWEAARNVATDLRARL
jgi:hypothetical protein